MDKNQFQDLLKAINEAHDSHTEVAKPAEKKKLTGPKGGNVFAHIDSNAFGLDDSAHTKAKELVSALRKSYTGEMPGAFQAIHDHLADSGVDTEDPHMKSLMASADEAAEENYEKSRSRAGL